MHLKDLKVQKKYIYEIAERYGAKNIYVFGSVARNESTDRSDIDFLVDFDAKSDLFDLMDLKEELESYLGQPVDIVTKHSLNHDIREQVLKEAVRL